MVKSKILLILILFISFCSFGADIDSEEPKSTEEIIKDISLMMVNLEDKLHDDRHDKAVQIDGREIEIRIEKLIKDAEKENKNNDSDNNKETGSKQKQLNEKMDSGKKKSELSKNKIGQIIHRERMPWETKSYYDWVHLSEQKRESIIQSYAPELPSLWRQRIAAYFFSINAEENLELGKTLKEKQKEAMREIIDQDMATKNINSTEDSESNETYKKSQ